MKRDHLLGFFQPSDLWAGEKSVKRPQPNKIKAAVRRAMAEDDRVANLALDKKLTGTLSEALYPKEEKPVKAPIWPVPVGTTFTRRDASASTSNHGLRRTVIESTEEGVWYRFSTSSLSFLSRVMWEKYALEITYPSP